jgi:hypothetical protein
MSLKDDVWTLKTITVPNLIENNYEEDSEEDSEEV